VPNVKKIPGLNLPDLPGPIQACNGTALLFTLEKQVVHLQDTKLYAGMNIQPYSLLTFTIQGDEQLLSRFGRFNPIKTASDNNEYEDTCALRTGGRH
jgi:hypothetical protein